MYHGGRAICNNFSDAGCNMSQCRFLHFCSFWGGGHARLTFHIRPLGIATRKKCIRMDLSASHGCTIPSINSLIPSKDFSLHYAIVNHPIALINCAKKGSWLSKVDITSTSKVLPILPLAVKLFNILSEALCWILSNTHNLLFLDVTPPSLLVASGLTALTSVFSNLGIPLSAEKTTSLEFLGVNLNTELFQASLPTEKLSHISLLILNFLLASSCTKHQLLSLLGHLNFALCIIPQGWAFITHLLSITSSVTWLLTSNSLDTSSRAGLHFWLYLLGNWNRISFYDDHLTHPHDINLFNDTAPSAGFGGFYKRKWFVDELPTELERKYQVTLSSLYKIYPIIIIATFWGYEWCRKSVLIYSDNLAVVDIINKGCSNSPSIMPFLCQLTWHSFTHQYILCTAHAPGHFNAIADSLSRFSFQKFRSLAPYADKHQIPVPPYSALTFNI
ncbi:uncharacterized protein LOC121942854 [Plectropomus leopardus]|uniref:uncharacterized protein LOC121942854 n=1 Tax=Plectropomus leopardus TaxID=160734 RepID=UPI001C4AD8D5|nr:uncharacterized protein LOC121942854 [Plectropomus leopardus]